MKKLLLIITLAMNTIPHYGQDGDAMVVRVKPAIQTCNVIDRKGDTIFTFQDISGRTYFPLIVRPGFPFIPDSAQYLIAGTGKTITIPKGCQLRTYGSEMSKNLFVIERAENRSMSMAVMNEKGKILIPFGRYNRLDYWKDDLFYAYKIGGGLGIINSRNEAIAPFQQHCRILPHSNPLTVVSGKDGSIYTVDSKGAWHPTAVGVRNLYAVSDSIIIAESVVERVYCKITTDLDGNIIIPASRKYKWIYPYSDGYAFFENEDKLWGIVDRKGNEVVPAIYSYIATNYKTRSTPIIDPPETFNNGLACVHDGKHWGAINAKGETVVPFVYSYLSPFADGVAVAMLLHPTRKYGVVNTKGEVVVPFEYEWMSSFVNGYAQATKNKGEMGVKMGIIDAKNEVIMPFNYHEIIPFTDSLFIEKVRSSVKEFDPNQPVVKKRYY